MTPTDERDFLRLARERFDRAYEAERENREEALDDLKFRAGEQWRSEDREARANRPCLTINRMPQFVRQVTGDIRLNKPSIKVRPVDSVSDPQLAKVLTGLIRHIESASDAQSAYVTAAEGAATCGQGHFRLTTDYVADDSFEQDIFIRRLKNHFAVIWDDASTELTREDANYCFVVEELPEDEFKARFPHANMTGWDGADIEDDLRDWYTGEKVRICEYWLKTPVDKTLWLMQDGSVIEVDGLDDITRATMQPFMLRERMAKSHKVCSYVISATEILEGPQEWAGKHIPIIPVLGEEVHIGERTVRHGLIRYAKDPQRMLNFMRSASAEMIALAPKAPWLVTKKQIEGHERRWNIANTANLPYLLYNPDPMAGALPQRIEPPPMQAALLNEAALCSDDMKAVTGIYDAALGARSNETSGKAILARQQEGDVGSFVYVDNLARSISYCGRQLIDLIPRIYDTARIIRILGEDDAEEMVPINQQLPDGTIINDITVGRYDVRVETGPSYSTKRAEAADSMMQFVQAVPVAGQLAADLIAKNMDWPGADTISERLKKALPPGIDEDSAPAEPPPPDPKLEAEVTKLAAQTEGVQLDNLRKQLEVAQLSGAFQAMVAQAVQQELMTYLGAPQPVPAPQGMPPQGDMMPFADPQDPLSARQRFPLETARGAPVDPNGFAPQPGGYPETF